ncbi:hypothetical protein SAMD00019534_007870 [Acytostelium subglobosum LB1]|uniref:hypothetical protein n=1 Tax=Acytostelium subglobosum LB1 TaxID=1410327 RepID=UPI0006447C7C|nr:hypothetical protein SAMD00019534_007870 [Acytostelium subglobosum LB1]GAM17612.1 hypothetical protein SAMD00019534_007870 [Acytostelium subglobosum LB1]|eukprot:XP_012758208.1 hypothetical protein SAMD00019534_007870 [Acytostelium subglobosum LB1]
MSHSTEDNEDIPQFTCPDWASIPAYTAYLQVTKNGEDIGRFDFNVRYLVFGRSNEFSQVLLDHPSVSRRHAALVYHGANDRFYLIDLQSGKGTFLNGERLQPNQPKSVKDGNVFTFGSSTREFVLRTAADGGNQQHQQQPQQQRQDKTRTVSCRHLLVKHRESRNPKSWREDNITRTKEAAIQQLNEYRQQIQSGQAKFEDLAKVYSDCSSAKRGGMLDPFTRGQMQKPFEDVSFGLEVGQLSDIVSTDSGVHIIERMA